MLNVCDPCLMVITRCPRRCSSAARRTVTVVLPLCFLPITATIGGCRMCLREYAFLGCVDVHEQHGRITEPRHRVRADPGNAHVVVERDDTAIAGSDPSLDGFRAGRCVIRAERLDAAPR